MAWRAITAFSPVGITRTETGDPQRRQRIHGAGGESPVAPIAEARRLLLVQQVVQIRAKGQDRLAHRFQNPQLDQVVPQVRPQKD